MGRLGVAGAIVPLLGFSACAGPESTTRTTEAAAPAATTTVPPATTTTTTTLPPMSITSEPEEDPNPFVGWWKATDADGSRIDLRVDAEGTFMY